MTPNDHNKHEAARPETGTPPRGRFRRAWQGLAVTCIGLGGIGVALPLVPTTPFLLLAAWAASRGSPELHAWLYRHPHYGPILRDWHECTPPEILTHSEPLGFARSRRSSQAMAVALVKSCNAELAYPRGSLRARR